MPTDLILIGRSGAAAARASIELTAQNIANASNPDYVRRSLSQSELVGTGRIGFTQTSSLGGVLIGDVQRTNNELIQRQVRDSLSDLSRAESELAGLRETETALEQSRLYESLVDFEASLTLLESDPGDPALRTGAIETARQLTETFQFADKALSDTRELVQAEVTASVDEVRGASAELARINTELVAARDGTAGKASLLDARDAALRDIAAEFGITTRFDEFGAVEVRLKADPPALLVQEGRFNTLTASFTANGSAIFNFGSLRFVPDSGAMAGRVAALTEMGTRQAGLDSIAAETITRANTAQAAGTAFDGTAGQPLFSGTRASNIALALSDGSGIAVAPAGAPAGSRDTSNLGNLIAAFGADDGPIAETDRSLLVLSSRISGLDTTREGLAIINASAQAELLSEAGVDLDEEAANLVRLQQAFDANSRVIQVASSIFDTILGLN